SAIMLASMEARTRDAWTYVLGLYGLGNLANGAWMLADPRGWYDRLPAGVPDFGPLNEHFARDIGSIFLIVGAALLGAALSRPVRLPGLLFAPGFVWLPALLLVSDAARGLGGPPHWLLDLGPVYLPAVVMVFALRAALREARS